VRGFLCFWIYTFKKTSILIADVIKKKTTETININILTITIASFTVSAGPKIKVSIKTKVARINDIF